MGFHPAICETDVAVPTVIVADREVMVQWFGVEDEFLSPKGQFLFPLTSKLEDITWDSNEKFQVVFLDQAKNWPDLEVARQIAEGRVDGMEAWVVILCSRYSMVQYPSGVGPGTFVGNIMMLGAPKTGIIIPQCYQNLSVLEKAPD